MKQQELSELLRGNAYPGRGIVLGLTPDGKRAALAYFIMGRSANSRSRAFVKDEDNLAISILGNCGIAMDTSLILYTPVFTLGRSVVVSNGDQTDTICVSLMKGGTFEGALSTRWPEPDAPHFTPRISGMLDFYSKFSYKLSILKAGDERGEATIRETFDYEPVNGTGHFIHTYQTDGEILPSFSGEPRTIAIPDSLTEFARELWSALNPENKVSLYVRYTDTRTLAYEDRIYNQYAGEEQSL